MATGGKTGVTANTLVALLQRSRSLVNADLTVQQLLVLAAVYAAGHEGVEQGALVEQQNLKRANVSKIIADLTRLTSTKKAGPDLIQSGFDTRDFRIRIVTCTPKGLQVMREILGET